MKLIEQIIFNLFILSLSEGVWEQGAEEDIWTKEGWGYWRMEKIA
jgi:hypothetical protein